MKKIFWITVVLVCLFAGAASAVTSPPSVKKSSSGICHDHSSPWYDRTRSFTPFPDLDSCLSSGGRLPKSSARSEPAPSSKKIYNRNRDFGSWTDDDGDCFNTRHELLAQLSTTAVTTRSCLVIHGRWNDPYTGRVFTEARNLDIDHLVPLKWAWDHGAANWDQNTRVSFANDARNLFAVEASANREKGASGPLDWLPPNFGFRCEYVMRFKRIALMWHLEMSPAERSQMDALQARVCARS